MGLAFRNVDVSPADPVQEWGFEGLLAAVDRGDITDWRRVSAAVRRDPRGDVAQLLVEVFEAAEDSGAVAAMRRYVALAVADAERTEQQAVVDELNELWVASGLDQGAYARRLGTSRTRLNAYLNGRTVPLATFMARARIDRALPAS